MIHKPEVGSLTCDSACDNSATFDRKDTFGRSRVCATESRHRDSELCLLVRTTLPLTSGAPCKNEAKVIKDDHKVIKSEFTCSDPVPAD
eukprot:3827713-Pyramimonas_sp.AAC.2